ncbi:MAG: TPM domain-containing protein, partial [Lachnospiraceae bacterium]|nr:TPM domain-containing protein [Lachnospiraceae bacterium]
RFAADAHNYVDPNSVDININKDTFLYATVTKTVRETKSSSGSSTHTSSSGRTHGGSHGSF